MNNFVNFDSIPKRANGSINWNKSEGCILPFIYNGIVGEIKILGYIPEKYGKKMIKIYIEGYTKIEYDLVSQTTLTDCVLGRVLHKKIIDTNPELVKYFADKNDAKKYSVQSNQRVIMNCPYCGYKKDQFIYNLYKFGFSCPICSDGISYPNKFMFSLLTQLGITFKNEVSRNTKGFEWVENYRYDFYFVVNNVSYFVEMDGHFHDNEDMIISDKNKDVLAKNHNISMIRINCKYEYESDRFEFIKKNILDSELSLLFNLSSINWDKCNTDAIDSKVYQSVILYNQYGYNIKKIAHELGVSIDTARGYLKIMSKAGMCEYNPEDSKEYRNNNLKNMSSKPVYVFKNNQLIYSFNSRKEASEQSIEKFGVFFHQNTIGRMCNGIINNKYGLIFSNTITIQN